MEQLIPILIQLVGGGAGGNLVAAVLKNVNLGKVIATITGLIGGVAGGQLAGLLPALQELLSAGGAQGNVAQGGVAAGGGAILTLIVGLIKKAMSNPAAP